MSPPVTPDGRYIVVRGRLWRRANPHLPEVERQVLVDALMQARRMVGTALRSGDADALKAARARVDAAKRGLGERGPVWWHDGAPDLNRRMARNTVYAEWWAGVSSPPCGEGQGVGVGKSELEVGRGARRAVLAYPAQGPFASRPPTPDPSPQGGGAERTHAASRPARASPRATRVRR